MELFRIPFVRRRQEPKQRPTAGWREDTCHRNDYLLSSHYRVLRRGASVAFGAPDRSTAHILAAAASANRRHPARSCCVGRNLNPHLVYHYRIPDVQLYHRGCANWRSRPGIISRSCWIPGSLGHLAPGNDGLDFAWGQHPDAPLSICGSIVALHAWSWRASRHSRTV